MGISLQINMILVMFDKLQLSHFLADLQKICDSLKELQKFFKMGPIWHFCFIRSKVTSSEKRKHTKKIIKNPDDIALV